MLNYVSGFPLVILKVTKVNFLTSRIMNSTQKLHPNV